MAFLLIVVRSLLTEGKVRFKAGPALRALVVFIPHLISLWILNTGTPVPMSNMEKTPAYQYYILRSQSLTGVQFVLNSQSHSILVSTQISRDSTTCECKPFLRTVTSLRYVIDIKIRNARQPFTLTRTRRL